MPRGSDPLISLDIDSAPESFIVCQFRLSGKSRHFQRSRLPTFSPSSLFEKLHLKWTEGLFLAHLAPREEKREDSSSQRACPGL
jgi:hypothetical protein